jgi:hypothetical protein
MKVKLKILKLKQKIKVKFKILAYTRQADQIWCNGTFNVRPEKTEVELGTHQTTLSLYDVQQCMFLWEFTFRVHILKVKYSILQTQHVNVTITQLCHS